LANDVRNIKKSKGYTLEDYDEELMPSDKTLAEEYMGREWLTGGDIVEIEGLDETQANSIIKSMERSSTKNLERFVEKNYEMVSQLPRSQILNSNLTPEGARKIFNKLDEIRVSKSFEPGSLRATNPAFKDTFPLSTAIPSDDKVSFVITTIKTDGSIPWSKIGLLEPDQLRIILDTPETKAILAKGDQSDVLARRVIDKMMRRAEDGPVMLVDATIEPDILAKLQSAGYNTVDEIFADSLNEVMSNAKITKPQAALARLRAGKTEIAEIRLRESCYADLCKGG